MRKLLLIAAAAALAGCAGRSSEETGAAPARDTTGRVDTTAVTHAIDTTRTGPPGVAGRPGNATINKDSVANLRRDTVTAQPPSPSDTAAREFPQDTSRPGGPGMRTDTGAVRSDTSMTRSDTTTRMGND